MKNLLSYAAANKTNAVLVTALGIQLVLAGGLFWLSSGQGEFSQAQTIAGFDLDAADSLIIDDGETTLTLARVDDNWLVKGDNAIPADTEAVIDALESLSELEARFPVATTESSQVQLEVADDNFQRKLTVKQGEDELAQLYMGTSPGFRKAHVRLAGEEAIHAARVNVFDFQTDEVDWLDRQHFAFNEVEGISGEGFAVRFENNAWVIDEPENLQQTHVVDTAIAEEFVSSLEALALTGIYVPVDDEVTELSASENAAGENLVSENLVSENAAGEDVAGEDVAGEDVAGGNLEGENLASENVEGESETEVNELGFTVHVDSQPVVLSMVREGDTAYVKRDDREGRFTISNSTFDKFSEFTAESLFSEKPSTSVN